MVGFILLFVSVCLVFTGKAVADTVSNEISWANSIFSVYDIESFWGSKDHTWKRKYKEDKILNYLFNTIFVFTTDIWHLANTIRRLGIYLGILAALIVNTTLLNELIIVSTYILLNVVGFHLLYTYILKK
jgi:hypothetical protein